MIEKKPEEKATDEICTFCGKVHPPLYEGAPYPMGDKAGCSDAWFEALGDEIEQHPIGGARRPFGCS